MEISTRRRRISRAVALVGAAGVLAASGAMVAAPAFAATETLVVTCSDGSTLTILVHDNHASQHGGWGVGAVVDGGSGKIIPTSFSTAAYDDTAGQYLFQSETTAKGGGQGNHNQAQVSCTQSMSDTIDNLIAQEGPPNGGLPDWAKGSDTVTMTFTVTGVAKG